MKKYPYFCNQNNIENVTDAIQHKGRHRET